ncbi:STAS domain-containing protein [Streptomyces montanisoli]|nr:STAS domain-containing protein [Streptomyces montanisoli]
MAEELRVEVVEERGRLAVAAVAGELDIATAGDLHTRVSAALATHRDLILDLADVGFCDSSGFNALLRIRRRVGETGGRLALAAPPVQVERLLALSGGGRDLFAVHPSRAEALAAYDAGDL